MEGKTVTERALSVDAREAKGLHDGSITAIVRVVDPQPMSDAECMKRTGSGYHLFTDDNCPGEWRIAGAVGVVCEAAGLRNGYHWRSPFGVVGDRLSVRETWKTGDKLDRHSPAKIVEMAEDAGFTVDNENDPCPLRYSCDGAVTVWGGTDEQDFGPFGRTRAAGNMPRWATRTLLDVTDVRVVRAREVSEEDAKATGYLPLYCPVVDEGTGDHLGDQPSFALALRRLYGEDKWLWLATVAKVETT